MWSSSVRKVLSAFSPLLHLDAQEICKIGRDVAIPVFEGQILEDLCTEATHALKRGGSLLRLDAPIYIVGDLHGNIFDLLRILIVAKPPPLCRFLFLGDYVDRGEYSIEVVALLFALLIAYPDHVFLIRGNHEFTSCNSVYGFRAEVEREYHCLDLYETINSVFEWLPIAAVVGGKYFCVHGGLSPSMTTIADFENFKRPVKSCLNEPVGDVVWGDPDPEADVDFEKSGRGSGFLFGVGAVRGFLQRESLSKVIRAHQCVQLGVQKMMSDCLYTVFSCSNYADAGDNRCGLLFVGSDLEIQMFSLPTLTQVSRSTANMKKVLTSTRVIGLNDGGIGMSLSEHRATTQVHRSAAMMAPPIGSHRLVMSTSTRPLRKYTKTGLIYKGPEIARGMVRSQSQEHA